MSASLQQLRTYQLQECLGGSSIAEVWKAFDLQSQGYVALKIFRTELQNDPFFMTRFWNLPLRELACGHSQLECVKICLAQNQTDRRRNGAELEPLAAFAEHGGQLVVDDFDELLAGRDGPEP